ncbi:MULTISPECIES: hypothetical protein [Exiguobacterium]|uniref:Uncharacterized protein n=1 Tax=Exiguobacterium aurantiacum TaxID=33987 RepID=A0A377FTB5_9BACL|nr:MULTISPECIES: hypothetical protein [Exiguobacterium]STO07998.1 Uncharacterised protein [Exiguobacterium aurantiacum]
MKDTLNGIILVGLLVLGMFAFFMVGEMRHVEVAAPVVEDTRSIEAEVARTEAETLEARIIAERAEKDERKTTWFASE